MVDLNDYEFMFGSGGKVFNREPVIGVDKYFIDITSIDGISSPPIKATESVFAGRDGGYIDATSYGIRTIVITGSIIVLDVDYLYASIDEAGRYFYPHNIGNDLFIKLPGRHVMQGRVRGAGFEYSINSKFSNMVVDFVGTLKMPDPRFYRSTQLGFAALSNTKVSELSVNVACPNLGNAPYYPSVTFHNFKGESCGVQLENGYMSFVTSTSFEFNEINNKILFTTISFLPEILKVSVDYPSGGGKFPTSASLHSYGNDFLVRPSSSSTINLFIKNASCDRVYYSVMDAWI